MATDERQRLAELMDYSLAQQQLTWEEVARRAGKGGSVPQLRAVRTGRSPLTVRGTLAIERGFGWPPGSVDGILANDQAVIAAIRRGDLVAPTDPADEDDGWTDEDEEIFQALTVFLRGQGLKPTPKIIQAMREEWERDRAQDAERDSQKDAG